MPLRFFSSEKCPLQRLFGRHKGDKFIEKALQVVGCYALVGSLLLLLSEFPSNPESLRLMVTEILPLAIHSFGLNIALPLGAASFPSFLLGQEGQDSNKALVHGVSGVKERTFWMMGEVPRTEDAKREVGMKAEL